MVFASWHPDGTATIYLRGELDLASAAEVQAVVDDVLADGARRVVFDGSRVDFVDLRGLHPLLHARTQLRRLDDEVRVWLHRPAACMRRLLAASGLEPLLPSLA